MARTTTDRQKIRDDHKDSWIAVETGDFIMGKIVDVTDAWSGQRRDPTTGQQGSRYPLLIIEAEEVNDYYTKPPYELPHELKVHCFGAVLFNEIMRKQPGIGERIRIVYQGAGEAKAGQNPPELYVVRAASGTDAARRAYDAIGGVPTSQPGPVQPQLGDDDIPF